MSDLAAFTLYTPRRRGLFRVSIYAAVQAVDAGAGSPVATLGWRDDSQPETVSASALPLTALGYSSLEQVVQSAGGQPINLDMTGGGTYGNARYSLYVAIDELI